MKKKRFFATLKTARRFRFENKTERRMIINLIFYAYTLGWLDNDSANLLKRELAHRLNTTPDFALRLEMSNLSIANYNCYETLQSGGEVK